MKGLVREVQRRASAVCNGKNVKAGVRARIYWLKCCGYSDRDAQGRIYVR